MRLGLGCCSMAEMRGLRRVNSEGSNQPQHGGLRSYEISSAILSAVTESDASRTELEPQATPLSVVLIVEDELLIADVDQECRSDAAGYPVLGPVVTYESAMSLAGEQRPTSLWANIDLRPGEGRRYRGAPSDGAIRHAVDLHQRRGRQAAANQMSPGGRWPSPIASRRLSRPSRSSRACSAGANPRILDGLTLFQSAVTRSLDGVARGLKTSERQGEDDVLV